MKGTSKPFFTTLRSIFQHGVIITTAEQKIVGENPVSLVVFYICTIT
jgi:hypothetical protein